MSDGPIDGDYEVGFGKPPMHSRWPKGVSGNPAGAKKGSRTVNEELTAILNERVTATANGQRRTMTKLTAILTQAVNQAAAGDLRAMKLVVDLARQSDNDEAMKMVIENAKIIAPAVQIFELPDNGR